MLAWVVYVTAAGCALSMAGLLAERGLRRLGHPARLAWAGAMAATLGLPVVLGLWRGPGVGGAGGPGVMGAAEGALVVAWLAVSLVLLASLRLSLWTVRRNERSWRSGRVDGSRVLVSSGFGPGVVGAVRPRIVLPGWVLASDAALRRLILLHEVEHVRARDTGLLLGGVTLAALVPWCVPLWWQLHRLREAIEGDCDQRVLAATGRPHEYANALVAVAGSRPHTVLAVPALAPRRSELERRVRRITAGSRDRSVPAGLALLAAAALLVLAVAAAPAPPPPGLDLERREATRPRPPEPVPGAALILSIDGGPGDRGPAAR